MPHNTPLRPASPTKTRRIKQSKEDRGFKIQFAFIDGAKSKEHRKKSRSHVTTQHYRRKRFEKAQANESNEPPTAPSIDQTRQGVPPELIASDRQREHMILPIPYYARGRLDPFAGSTLPIPVTTSIHKLVDHYCYVIPSLMHRHWSRPTRRARSAWDLFDLYRRDALSFIGILHHASKHLEGMYGLRSESASTTTWKLRTISGIQARLAQYPPGSSETLQTIATDNGLLIAIGLLANGERLWGDRAIARIHWAAVKRMLQARGGFASLTGNRAMHTKLLWSYIALTATSAYLPHDPDPAYIEDFAVAGMSIPFPSFSAPTSAPAATDTAANAEAATATAIPTDAALSLSIDEFTHLLRVRLGQDAARSRSHQRHRQHQQHQHGLTPSNPTSQPPEPLDTLARHLAPPTSSLHACLAPSDPPQYAHPDKHRAHENCRMACLLLLNIVAAELSSSSSSTSSSNSPDDALERWFTSLSAAVDDDGGGGGNSNNGGGGGKSDASGGPEHLLWLLLSEPFGGEAVKRVWKRGWKVARLLGVAKRLGASWWRGVGGGLWALLLGGGDGGEGPAGVGAAGGVAVHGWWDAEAFAEEVRMGARWVEADGDGALVTEAGTCYLGATNCLLRDMGGKTLCTLHVPS